MLINRATRLEVSQGQRSRHGTIRYVMHGFLLVCYSNFVPKTHHFEIFDFTLKSESTSSELARIDPPPMTSY